MRRRSFVAALLATSAYPAFAQTTPGHGAAAPATTTPPAAPSVAAPGVAAPGANAPAGATATNAPLAVRQIEPQNALEYAFVQALTNENMRPIFRRYLMDTHVALAMTSAAADAEPLQVALQNGTHAIAVFTSAERVDTVLGEDAPRIMIAGRAAFERARGKNIVINFHLIPMLTLEPEDIVSYLAAQPGVASAGPSQ